MTNSAALSDQDLEELVAGRSAYDLIRLHRLTLYKLKHERRVVRTWNQVQADWAERLVEAAYNGRRADKNAKGYDVMVDDDTRVEVKSIVYYDNKVGSKQTSDFSSCDDFDRMVVVVLDERDLSVVQAIALSSKVVDQKAKCRENGRRFLTLSRAQEALKNAITSTEVSDETKRLKAAQRKVINP